MSSLYFTKKVMFDKRLQEIKPEIKRGVNIVKKKRTKKARKKRKQKRQLKGVFKQLGNNLTLQLLLQLLGRRITPEKKVEVDKAPRRMKLARGRAGRGLPDVRGRQPKRNYGKKVGETDKSYKTRLNAELLADFPQMFLFKQLMETKNEAQAKKVLKESELSKFTTENLNRPLGRLFRLKSELLRPGTTLTSAQVQSLNSAILGTINSIDAPIVQEFIRQDVNEPGGLEVREGVAEGEKELEGILSRKVERRGSPSRLRPKEPTKRGRPKKAEDPGVDLTTTEPVVKPPSILRPPGRTRGPLDRFLGEKKLSFSNEESVPEISLLQQSGSVNAGNVKVNEPVEKNYETIDREEIIERLTQQVKKPKHKTDWRIMNGIVSDMNDEAREERYEVYFLNSSNPSKKGFYIYDKERSELTNKEEHKQPNITLQISPQAQADKSQKESDDLQKEIDRQTLEANQNLTDIDLSLYGITPSVPDPPVPPTPKPPPPQTAEIGIQAQEQLDETLFPVRKLDAKSLASSPFRQSDNLRKRATDLLKAFTGNLKIRDETELNSFLTDYLKYEISKTKSGESKIRKIVPKTFYAYVREVQKNDGKLLDIDFNRGDNRKNLLRLLKPANRKKLDPDLIPIAETLQNRITEFDTSQGVVGLTPEKEKEFKVVKEGVATLGPEPEVKRPKIRGADKTIAKRIQKLQINAVKEGQPVEVIYGGLIRANGKPIYNSFEEYQKDLQYIQGLGGVDAVLSAEIKKKKPTKLKIVEAIEEAQAQAQEPEETTSLLSDEPPAQTLEESLEKIEEQEQPKEEQTEGVE